MVDSNRERLQQTRLIASLDTISVLNSPRISDMLGQACQEVAPRYEVDPSPELVAAVRDALRYRRETPALCLRLAEALTDIRRLMAEQCAATIAGSLQGEVACESILPYPAWSMNSPAEPPATLPSPQETNATIGGLGMPCSWDSGVTH